MEAGGGDGPVNDQDLDVGDENILESDLQAAMQAAIQEKKKQKFDKMIEKGSKIAAQQQDQVMS